MSPEVPGLTRAWTPTVIVAAACGQRSEKHTANLLRTLERRGWVERAVTGAGEEVWRLPDPASTVARGRTAANPRAGRDDTATPAHGRSRATRDDVGTTRAETPTAQETQTGRRHTPGTQAQSRNAGTAARDGQADRIHDEAGQGRFARERAEHAAGGRR